MGANDPIVTATHGEWQPWFAWRPVKCRTTWPERFPPRWTWLRGIERRRIRTRFEYAVDSDLENHITACWEYKQPW